MSKKNSGQAVRQLNTGSDQDALSTEEAALEASMMKDDGAELEDNGAAAAKAAADKADKAAADKAAADKAGDGFKPGEAADKQVSLAALHESRAKEKELRELLKKAEDDKKADATRFATLEARTNLILEKLVPKEKPVEEKHIPNFQEDPAGWIAGTMEATGKTLAQLQDEIKTLVADKAKGQELQKVATEQSAVLNFAANAEREFLAANPDYDEAGKYLQAARIAQLEDLYNPQEVQAIIQQEKFAIASKAQASGKNPAEVVYKMAKAIGWKKAEAPPTGETPEAKAAAAKAKLEAANKGREQSASLSDARGQGPAPLTAARLLEMSEAEFAAAMETPEGIALMGR